MATQIQARISDIGQAAESVSGGMVAPDFMNTIITRCHQHRSLLSFAIGWWSQAWDIRIFSSSPYPSQAARADS
jgi:hypothetical protein